MRGSWERFAGSVLGAALLGVALTPAPPVAADTAYAPVERAGPALTVPVADLEAAYTCRGDFGSPRQPVLFVPGTGTTPAQAFEWNYGNYFTAEGRPYCTVTLPHEARGDIQVAAEYIVHAIRRTHEQSGRPIGVLGHSQGGMSPRWALRFWPDTRAMVADQIGMAGSNHGVAPSGCSPESPCTLAYWQQQPDSLFLTALNAGAETFAGIDYTQIYTRHDQTVVPTEGPRPSSALFTGDGDITNVATQSICPGSRSEHLTMGTIDPVTHALVMDALNHDGPADPARIDPSVCSALLMPGITIDLEIAGVLAILVNKLAESAPAEYTSIPMAGEEPPLRCYVFAAGCGPDGSATAPDDSAATDDLVVPSGGPAVDVAATGTTALGGGSGEVDGGGSSLPATGLTASPTATAIGLALLALGAQAWSIGRLGTRTPRRGSSTLGV